MKADKWPRMCWALKHVRTGEIATCSIVETEREANLLLTGHEKHLPHRGKHVAVPIMLTVERS